MIDIPSTIKVVNEAIAGVKSLVELIGKFKTVAKPSHEDISAAYERIINLQQAILNTKEALVFLKDENAQLKEQIRELKDFENYRHDFALKEIAPGALAYVNKDAKETYKGIPWYCQHCFEKHIKCVFQLAKQESKHDIYQCYSCSSQLRVPNGKEQLPEIARRPGKWDSFI